MLKEKMRKWAFVCVCSFAMFICSAQQPDPIQHIIEFKLSHVIDSLQPDNPFQQNFLLLLGKRMSWYDLYVTGMQVMGKPQTQTVFDKAGNAITASVSAIRNSLLKDVANKKLITEITLLQIAYDIEEPLPEIAWEILPETKVVNIYKCQKAIGAFKGRVYTAWFSTQLPYRTGPWKLGGLPGLILEAYDAKREVVFECVSFYPLFEGAGNITLRKDAVSISPEKYKKLKTTLENDPTALRGAFAGRDPNVVATNVRAGTATTVAMRPRKFNNPLEKE